MRTTRRSLIGAALAAPLLPRFAKAAEFSLRVAHTAPLTFPIHVRLTEAAEQVARESNGRVELQIFPDSQLGGDNDLLSQARSGAIDFCQPTGQILASILPVTAISALGFAWSGYDKLWPAMDGELGSYIRADHRESRPRADGAHVGSGVPTHHHQHEADQNRRRSGGPENPVPGGAQFGDVVQDVEGGAVGDAVHGTLLRAANPYRGRAGKSAGADPGDETVKVQKYCSLTAHVWDGQWWVCNAATWNGLPEPVRQVVAKGFNDAALKERADIAWKRMPRVQTAI